MRLVDLPVVISLAALAACHGGTMGGNGDAGASSPAPPPGAIRLADDYYMAPRGAGHDGCPSYSPWSGRSAVPAAIYYRKADGGFTLYRSDADCGERPVRQGTGGES